jgi:hypothetical protein
MTFPDWRNHLHIDFCALKICDSMQNAKTYSSHVTSFLRDTIPKDVKDSIEVRSKEAHEKFACFTKLFMNARIDN